MRTTSRLNVPRERANRLPSSESVSASSAPEADKNRNLTPPIRIGEPIVGNLKALW